jgi:putative transposase
VDAWLLRACAVLGVKLTHSTPGRPQGRGKIERLFLTVREQFLVEITGDPGQGGRRHVADIGELNRLFTAWAETLYHRRVHSETGQAPLQRWADGWKAAAPPLPEPGQLHEAFLWSERRTVRKTATVSLHGNTYQVDPSLALRKVELVFDPFDLTGIDVRWQGRPAGNAVPHIIGRHAHPKARPEQPVPPAPATGIDYIGLLDTAHDTRLAGAAISFAGLSDPPPGHPGLADPGQLPGQLTIDQAIAATEEER